VHGSGLLPPHACQTFLNYEVLFDVGSAPLIWEPASIALPLFLLGTSLIWHAVLGRARRWLYVIALIVAGPSFFAWYVINDYSRLERRYFRNALAEGRGKIVEGKITDYVSRPLRLDAFESWKLAGIPFSYRAEEVTHAFHTPARRRGPVLQGSQLRVTYLPVGRDNRILRLEMPTNRHGKKKWKLPLLNRAVRWTWGLGLILMLLLEFRRRRGPFGQRDFAGAQFLESLVSGRSHDGTWKDHLNINNALLIVVHEGRLTIRPVFPFDLIGLGTLMNFDISVPLADVASAEPIKQWWVHGLRISFLGAGRQLRSIEVFPTRPEQLREALILTN
jgi:hypothetical protein